MGYTVGISSGMFSIAQGEEKEQYLTILRKLFWGAQKGVNFTQLDLESITEFKEPFLKQELQRAKDLGIKFGIHGETKATTGILTTPLDSAKPSDYARGHQRLLEQIKGGGEIGSDYVLIHGSESEPLILLEQRDLSPKVVADFYGRPFDVFLNKNPNLVNWGIRQKYLMDIVGSPYNGGTTIKSKTDYIYSQLETNAIKSKTINQKENEKTDTNLNEGEKNGLKERAEKMAIDSLKEELITGVNTPSNNTYGIERVAYILVGKWMEMNRDNLWKNIVGNKSIDDMLKKPNRGYDIWGPAVSAKYIWGHFNPLSDGRFEDPKPLLEKYNLKWIFETEMAMGGYETHTRLSRILHMYYLVMSIGSKWLGVAVDAEHLLSCNLDPKKEIDALPSKGGERIFVCHLGWPTPHKPAHVPLYLGSEAQQYWYELLWKLKNKGMKDAILIFERGGGKDPVSTSVLAIRKMVKYLEMETPPNKLPDDFYGLSKEGPQVARQEGIMKKHFMDPLRGLMVVPEEEYGFLGTAAREKGKIKEWSAEEYK